MKNRKSSGLLFASNNKSKFVDREEIRGIVTNECNKVKNNPNYFKVIDIYGLGGMGKSSLLAELKKDTDATLKGIHHHIIYVSFEIDRNQTLQNLIRIRKKITDCCTIFDYALINYWDKSGCVEKIDDSFMYKIRDGLWSGLVDTAADIGGCLLPDVIALPSIRDIFECVRNLVQKVQKFPMRNYLEVISQLDPQDLLEKMPEYLGYDIERIISKKSSVLVFLCDSYQQSVPYSESKEWLMNLVAQVHMGLFIITGREKLKWYDAEKEIIPYHLQSFSEQVARNYIYECIPDASDALVNEIIISSQCLPLFVNIAIDLYKSERSRNFPINISFFKDRDEMMKRFIYHFPQQWHSIILALSVVGVFNREIFTELGKRLGCNCPLEDYEEIVNTSLSDYIECGNGIVKIHDVFCSHAVGVLTLDYKKEVWNNYLQIILYRRDSYLADSQNVLITLFLNLIQRMIDLQLSITIQESEWLLDIFFHIVDKRAFFIPPAIVTGERTEINDIILFINSVIYEKVNTVQTYKMLTSIKNPSNFGRHKNSYNILLLYSKCLLGDYVEYCTGLNKMESEFDDSDIPYWYYPRTKNYIADFLMMDGKFINAMKRLITLKNNEISENMIFQINRAIGHIYRFNMNLEMAEKIYSEQCIKQSDYISSRIYLQTNLCETYCFYKLKEFDDLYEETLKEAKALKSYRNIGKLYYSKAIALIQKQQFNRAYKMIKNSIEVNRNDGYKSGELFALMAQSYCDFAKIGHVRQNTTRSIENLLNKNKVYQFFRLPLYIMSNNKQGIETLRYEYEWLDFDRTVEQYTHFINALRSKKKTE